jgi:hypothetical protein
MSSTDTTGTTPRTRGARLGELTSGELANSLRASSWLLGEQMGPYITDKTLLAKLSSLHADLKAEEEDRKKYRPRTPAAR